MWSSTALPWAPTAADTSALSVCLMLSFSLYSSLFLLHPFLSVILLHCISLVSSPWPFAIVLCQTGIWNQPFFISSDLCLSLLMPLPFSYWIYIFPLSAALLFTLLCSFGLLVSFTSSCCPLFFGFTVSFLMLHFFLLQVALSSLLMFFFTSISTVISHTNTIHFSDMHTGGCICFALFPGNKLTMHAG